MNHRLAPRPSIPAPTPWSFPDFTSTSLPNGLTVRSAHLPGKPLVAASLVLTGGSDLDPEGLEGLASLLAGLLDEGTTKRSAQEWADALDLLGVDWSIGADATSLRLDVECPGRSLSAALELIAEALTSPALDQRAFERVSRQLLDSARSAESSPGALAQLAHRTSLWTPQSRAHVPSSGSPESLARLTHEHVTALAATLTPVGATLLVAGDLTGVDVTSAAALALGSWSGAPAPRAARTSTPAASPRLVLVERPDLVQSELVLGSVVGSRTSPDWCARQIATQVLGGSISSRLDALMREEKGYTYGVHAYVIPGAVRGTWAVSGSVEASATLEAVADLFGEVARIAEDLTEDEVSAASAFMVATSPLRWEGPLEVVRQASALVAAGLEPSWVDSYLTGLGDVTLESAKAALKSNALASMSLTVVGSAEHAQRLADLTGLPLEVR